MNIYNYLKRDHLKVSKLFEAITSTKNIEEKVVLFEKLKKELLLHSHSEDATFYAALRKHKDTEKIVEHAKGEHQEVEEYLGKLANISIESEQWMEALKELRHAVTHHVKEEENDMFAKAKEVLSEDQEKQLAIDMEQLKGEVDF